MSDNGYTGDQGGDGRSSHRPGAVRRALAKVKNTAGVAHGTTKAAVDPTAHPHPTVEDVANTVGYSLVHELLEYVKGPEGEDALEVIFTNQSRVAARLAITDDAKRATRIAAEEAMTGTYDGAQQKWQEILASLNKSFLVGASVVLGSYLVLLSVGVLFSLWRFALFGLR